MTTPSQAARPTIDFDTHAQDHWTSQEGDNVKIVVDFFQRLMNEHDFDYILETYGHSAYVQHNRAIPDGIHRLVTYVKDLTKRFPEYSFDVKRVIASGDFVVTHSHTTMKAKHRGDEKRGFIITDTFRLENGQLAEHWDAVQPIDLQTRFLFLLIGGKVGNGNPVF